MRRSLERMDALERFRLTAVLPHIRGRLLDLGCGYNNLVGAYGCGIGVDVHRWNGIDVQIGDAAMLPFADGSFDTVAIIAALNHMSNREAALEEIRRVLRPDGRLLITMIGPFTGRLAHLVFTRDEKVRNGFHEHEKPGMTKQEVRQLLRQTGFRVTGEHRFELGLNTVFVASQSTAPSPL